MKKNISIVNIFIIVTLLFSLNSYAQGKTIN